MKIDDLVEQLLRMKERKGNVEVTMIGTLQAIDRKNPFDGAFESTIESLLYREDEFADEKDYKRVLLAWQT